MAFKLLQTSIQPLGYQLEEDSRDHVGEALASHLQKFRRKMDCITNGKKKRKRLRSESWMKLGINLTKQSNHLRANVEEKAAQLY